MQGAVVQKLTSCSGSVSVHINRNELFDQRFSISFSSHHLGVEGRFRRSGGAANDPQPLGRSVAVLIELQSMPGPRFELGAVRQFTPYGL